MDRADLLMLLAVPFRSASGAGVGVALRLVALAALAFALAVGGVPFRHLKEAGRRLSGLIVESWWFGSLQPLYKDDLSWLVV